MGAVLLSIGIGIFSFWLGVLFATRIAKRVVTEVIKQGQQPYIGENGSLMWRMSFSKPSSKIETFQPHENDSQTA